jgi:hypothetical protein
MTAVLYRPDVVDEHVLAWDNFIASVDPVKVEAERMRSGDLNAERFGSREHHEAMWLHEARRVESRRAIAAAQVPIWFADWQLAVAWRAEDSRSGPMRRSGGRVASPPHENTSTEVNPATGLVASNAVTTEKEAA